LRTTAKAAAVVEEPEKKKAVSDGPGEMLPGLQPSTDDTKVAPAGHETQADAPPRAYLFAAQALQLAAAASPGDVRKVPAGHEQAAEPLIA
jgi:hypothetical protein